MANKKWDYVVVFQNPEDITAGLTPAKRREEECEVSGTTVARALSVAKKKLAEDWEVPARELVILDIVRANCPLVAEWVD